MKESKFKFFSPTHGKMKWRLTNILLILGMISYLYIGQFLWGVVMVSVMFLIKMDDWVQMLSDTRGIMGFEDWEAYKITNHVLFNVLKFWWLFYLNAITLMVYIFYTIFTVDEISTRIITVILSLILMGYCTKFFINSKKLHTW